MRPDKDKPTTCSPVTLDLTDSLCTLKAAAAHCRDVRLGTTFKSCSSSVARADVSRLHIYTHTLSLSHKHKYTHTHTHAHTYARALARERERERERDRQTDRETDRQTDRERERETGTDRQTKVALLRCEESIEHAEKRARAILR